MMDDRMDRTIQEAAAEYHRPPEAPREEIWRRIEAARAGAAPGAGRLDGSPATPAGATVLPFRRRALRFGVPVGVAALLALGFALGRVTSDDVPSRQPVIASERPGTTTPGAPNATRDSAAAVPTRESADQPLQLAAGPSNPGAAEPSSRAAAPPSRPAEPVSQVGAEPPSSGAIQPPSDSRSGALTVAAREHLAQAEAFLSLFRASINAGQPIEPVVPATARYLLASNRLLIDSPVAEEPGMRRLLGDVELVLAQIAQMPADSTDGTDERLITDGIEEHDLMLRIRTAAGDSRGQPNYGVL